LAGSRHTCRQATTGRQAHWQAGSHTWQAGTFLAVRQASSQAFCQVTRKAVTHWQAGRQALLLAARKAGKHILAGWQA
jgi:hypothetical protein